MPARGYTLRTIPKVAVPAPPHDRPGPAARRRCAAPSSRPARRSTKPAPRSSSASAATSRPRPTSPRAGAGIPIVVHEQNARPGLANRLGARMTRVRGDDVRVHGAAPRHRRRDAAAAGDRPAGPGRPPGRGAGRTSGCPTPGPPCWSPAGRWAPSGSTPPSPSGSTPCAPPACRCCTSAAWARSSSRAADGSGAAVRRAAVRRPDGPRLRGGRPRGGPRRGQHRLRADRRRPAGGLRPAARSATASSGSTRPTSSPPAGESWPTTPR